MLNKASEREKVDTTNRALSNVPDVFPDTAFDFVLGPFVVG